MKQIRNITYWKNFVILFVALAIAGYIFIPMQFLIYSLGISFLTALAMWLQMKNVFDIYKTEEEALKAINKKTNS